LRIIARASEDSGAYRFWSSIVASVESSRGLIETTLPTLTPAIRTSAPGYRFDALGNRIRSS
jgi:hypothetical protein